MCGATTSGPVRGVRGKAEREVYRVLLTNQADPANDGVWFTDTAPALWMPEVVAVPEEEIETSAAADATSATEMLPPSDATPPAPSATKTDLS